MKPYRALLTFGTLVFALGWNTHARASDEVALSFELEPTVQDDVVEETPEPVAAEPPPQTLVAAEAPLPIPPGAENPPLSGDTTWPAGVYGGVDAIALGNVHSVRELLPAPPPAPAPVQVAAAIKPVEEPEKPPEELGIFPEEDIDNLIALNLDLTPREKRDKAPKTPTETAAVPAKAELPAIAPPTDPIQAIFEGGTDSLVARAVGSAEGTRTPEGHKNPAYFGHIDPGNGVWNMGTFSYQHGANTPEEADARQLKRLQNQTQVLQVKAQEKGLDLTQEELLNGIDLANQAPLAALDRGGYIDWLKEAHNLGMTGSEAIIWARTRSFIDPDTQRWNAPGLGNNVYSISHDQERRANAIARAINATALVTRVAQVPPEQPAQQEPPEQPQPMTTLPPVALDLALKRTSEAASAIAANTSQSSPSADSEEIANAAKSGEVGLQFAQNSVSPAQDAVQEASIRSAEGATEASTTEQALAQTEPIADDDQAEPQAAGTVSPDRIAADLANAEVLFTSTTTETARIADADAEVEQSASSTADNLATESPQEPPQTVANKTVEAPNNERSPDETERDEGDANASIAASEEELATIAFGALSEDEEAVIAASLGDAEADVAQNAETNPPPDAALADTANAVEDVEEIVEPPAFDSAAIAETASALPFTPPKIFAPQEDHQEKQRDKVKRTAEDAPAKVADAPDSTANLLESLNRLQRNIREEL